MFLFANRKRHLFIEFFISTEDSRWASSVNFASEWARSSPPGDYWVTAVGALHDASALSTTCQTISHTAKSPNCLRTGIDSFNDIMVSLETSRSDSHCAVSETD